MMQSADLGQRDDLARADGGDRTRVGRVLAERERRPRPVVVREVGSEESPHVLFVEHDGEDDQDEEHATRECRHREEVDGDERGDVVPEERAPRLGRRPTPTGQQPCNRSLGNGETECHELAVDPWRAPQRVRGGHVADKASEVLAQTRASTDLRRLPGPVPGEAAPMLPDDRGRAQDDQSGAPVGPGPPEAEPEEPIGPTYRRPASGALVHGQLLPEREVLERQRPMPARVDRQQAKALGWLGDGALPRKKENRR